MTELTGRGGIDRCPVCRRFRHKPDCPMKGIMALRHGDLLHYCRACNSRIEPDGHPEIEARGFCSLSCQMAYDQDDV